MTLTELRTKLVAAATGNDIQQVYFDWNKILDETLVKTYPIVLWDIDNMEGERTIRTAAQAEDRQTVTMNAYVGNVYAVDSDKIVAWDAIIEDMDKYLLSLNLQTNVQVDLIDVTYELLPAGFLSVDREIAVRYRVELKLWC